MSRLRSKISLRSHRPFAGTGASLYVGHGSPDPGESSVEFRRLRLRAGSGLAGAESGIGDTNTAKTSRVDYVDDTVEEFSYTIPGAFASEVVYLQVCTFKDDVENTSNYRPARIELDGSLDTVDAITGTAVLLSQQQRDGGVVRLRFLWQPDTSGLTPTEFAAMRTAGPTSPADATVAYSTSGFLYEIDTPALSDASAYTYKIQARRGVMTADLLTGISVTADATGPVVPVSGSAEEW